LEPEKALDNPKVRNPVMATIDDRSLDQKPAALAWPFCGTVGIDATETFDGDKVMPIVVGAPNGTALGESAGDTDGDSV